MTDDSWFTSPQGQPEPLPAAPEPPARDVPRRDRSRRRLAAGGLATTLAITGVVWAQSTHGSTATATTTTASGTSSTGYGVSVGSSTGTGQVTSAGS